MNTAAITSTSPLQAEFIGLGVITLDALMRREWVKEEELATEIKVHPKVLRRVLRYFEQVGYKACTHNDL